MPTNSHVRLGIALLARNTLFHTAGVSHATSGDSEGKNKRGFGFEQLAQTASGGTVKA